jgi:hypothetical protein
VEAALLGLARWLDWAGVSAWSAASPWVYPIANVAHLLGLVMLVGGIGVVDLRVAGLWRRIALAPLVRALTPVAVVGIAIQAASGTILFAADGAALARSGVFHLKLVLIALALANALAFRLMWQRRIETWSEPPPIAARAMAGGSLLLWLWIGTLGRLIAYS